MSTESNTNHDPLGLKGLAAALRGRLLERETADPKAWQAAARVWSGAATASPRFIAECATTSDVRACVLWAREHRDIPISVLAGGHSISGKTHIQDGFTISLAPMRNVIVDPERKTAWVGGGALWGDVDTTTAMFELHTVAGAVSHTGVSGLTLGGGYDPAFSREYGMACDHVLEAEVVLADGSVVRANEKQNPDLFWAIRGGGGSFGIVTNWLFSLFSVPDMYAGPIVFPMAKARDLLTTVAEVWRTCPLTLTIYVAFQSMPGLGPVCIALTFYHGDMGTDYSRPKELLAPIRKLEPVADFCGPLKGNTPVMHTFLDPGFPHGCKIYMKGTSVHKDDLTPALIDYVLAAAETLPTPLSALVLEHWGGKATQKGGPDCAYTRSEAAYTVMSAGGWEDDKDKEQAAAWSRKVSAGAAALLTKRCNSYVNFSDGHEKSDAMNTQTSESFQRLKLLRKKFDPTALLCNGHYGRSLDE